MSIHSSKFGFCTVRDGHILGANSTQFSIEIEWPVYQGRACGI